MQQTVLSFLIFLLSFTTIMANNEPISSGYPTIPLSSVLCNITPPSNFKVKNVGTTSVKLIWDYKADAIGGYEIKTFRSSDNLLVNTTIRSQDQLFAIINNLEIGTSYYSQIRSICDGGGVGEIFSETNFKTLILDLVVVGFSSSNNPGVCSLTINNQVCYFPSTNDVPQYFRVTRGTNTTQFRVLYYFNEADPENSYAEVQTLENDPSPFKFKCFRPDLNEHPSAPCDIKTLVQINLGTTPFARFAVKGGESETAYLEGNFLMSNCGNCKIEHLYPLNGGLQAPDPSYTGLRSGLPNTPDFAAVAPNPFNDRLQVYVDDPSAESVHCQLFNVNGQKVLDQQFQGAQDTYELITENLANGFYLLRVEANGMVQTLRVIKAE